MPGSGPNPSCASPLEPAAHTSPLSAGTQQLQHCVHCRLTLCHMGLRTRCSSHAHCSTSPGHVRGPQSSCQCNHSGCLRAALGTVTCAKTAGAQPDLLWLFAASKHTCVRACLPLHGGCAAERFALCLVLTGECKGVRLSCRHCLYLVWEDDLNWLLQTSTSHTVESVFWAANAPRDGSYLLQDNKQAWCRRQADTRF
jgi:hypothetical protein